MGVQTVQKVQAVQVVSEVGTIRSGVLNVLNGLNDLNERLEVSMFLSAQTISAMEGVRRVHSLNPAAIRTDKSLGDEVGLKNIGIHLI